MQVRAQTPDYTAKAELAAMRKVAVALDGISLTQALALTEQVGHLVGALKVNHLWDDVGPDLVEHLRRASHYKGRIWVDLKLMDIPETVAKRAAGVRKAGADMLTVMALGGKKMMETARENGPAEVIAVTVLTSLDPKEVENLFHTTTPIVVRQLAELAHSAGLRSLVCSPKEVDMLSHLTELDGMKFITPGVRSPGAETHDQARVDTPANAIANGASMVVAGRQIVQAPVPFNALRQIAAEIGGYTLPVTA